LKPPKFDEDGKSFNIDMEMEKRITILDCLLLLIISVYVIFVVLI
jgi:hypothetical protein